MCARCDDAPCAHVARYDLRVARFVVLRVARFFVFVFAFVRVARFVVVFAFVFVSSTDASRFRFALYVLLYPASHVLHHVPNPPCCDLSR